MPIVIWGSRGLTSNLERGRFYCPRCDRERGYDLKQVRPFFTLYFIPLFPIGSAERYVECHGCGGTYREGVLDQEPPTEGQRMLGRIADDLERGMSLDEAEERLAGLGMDRSQARSIVAEMAGDGAWDCGGCNRRYVKGVKRCRACRDA